MSQATGSYAKAVEYLSRKGEGRQDLLIQISQSTNSMPRPPVSISPIERTPSDQTHPPDRK